MVTVILPFNWLLWLASPWPSKVRSPVMELLRIGVPPLVTGRPATVGLPVSIRIKGDEIEVDLTATAPQVADQRVDVAPALMDAGMRTHLRQAAEQHAPGKWTEMPSGAFHDAGVLSAAGLGMAEAMYFGKPVIATAYSGNLDFTNDLSALLVDHQLVPVGPGEYPFAEGSKWGHVEDADGSRRPALAEQLIHRPQEGCGHQGYTCASRHGRAV